MYDNNLPVAVVVIQSFLVSKTFQNTQNSRARRINYQNSVFNSIFSSAAIFSKQLHHLIIIHLNVAETASLCSKYRRLVNIIIQVVQYLRNPRERNLSSRALMEVYYTNSRCLTLMFCSKIRTVVAVQLSSGPTFHYRCSRMLICFFTR